jgi:hypothetical protein
MSSSINEITLADALIVLLNSLKMILVSNTPMHEQVAGCNRLFATHRVRNASPECVYLLLVAVGGSLLVHVGFTRRPFAVRLAEHRGDKEVLASMELSCFLQFDDQLRPNTPAV